MYQLPKAQISDGSFSSVSTPIFATKASFFSIFRDLQNHPAEFCKILQNSAKFSKILVKFQDSGKMLLIFSNFLQNFAKSCKFLENLARSFCRSRKMLKNDALVAKIGVDTAENGPSEVSWVIVQS